MGMKAWLVEQSCNVYCDPPPLSLLSSSKSMRHLVHVCMSIMSTFVVKRKERASPR
jgi:hypothetical protein